MPMSTAASRSDEAAEIAGSASIWKLLNICRGKVALSRPEMKIAITVSSKDWMKAKSAATRKAGRSIGKVTRRKAVKGRAPRLAAAFSTLRSKLASAEVKVSTTTGMARQAWARMTPCMLCTRPSEPK